MKKATFIHRFFKHRSAFLAALCAVWTVVSCAPESVTPSSGDGKVSLTVTLRRGTPHNEEEGYLLKASDTESGDTDGAFNENKIERLTVIFFDQSGAPVWVPKTGAVSGLEGIFTHTRRDVPLTPGLTYTVWAFANLPADVDISGKTTSELGNILVSLPGLSDTNGVDALASIPMAGSITFTYSTSMPSFGTVMLERMLAKVRLRIERNEQLAQYVPKDANNTPINDDFWGKPQFAFLGGATNGWLLPGGASYMHTREWYESAASPDEYFRPMLLKEVNLPPTFATEYTSKAPVYTFPLDWLSDPDLAPEMLIRLPLYMGTEPIDPTDHTKATWYYYRVVFTQFELLSESKKLEANHLYDLIVRIERLGTTECMYPISLPGKVEILPWNNGGEVPVNVAAEDHYLYVTPMESDMFGGTQSFRFSSSEAVSVTVESGYYYTYHGVTGERYTNQISGPYLGTVSVTGGLSGTLTLTRRTPPYNSPEYLTLKVTTRSGLTRTVKVTHYPDIIVVAELSLEPNLSNPNMYTFTISRYNPDWAYKSNGYVIGYPDTEHPTGEDEKTVSPRFQVSSWSFGDKTGLRTYAEAKAYCDNYTERHSTGTLSDWRLPSRAELQIISDVTLKVGTISTGRNTLYPGTKSYDTSYWSLTDHTDISEDRVRCVRDVK